ncbi:hypothetical protein K488DRAFT_85477 [Vararia minispora EC-137]|uniref:Uncharacterized protein n=1 Tax=Vararia minispora EC-137 TaxID=1314806 RepID=A0ACB8QLV1_9AGAM|nr:hypothetical protein K488DRAFT_85477 [Vararia minispora EC-137]
MSSSDVSRRLRAILQQPLQAEAEVELYGAVDEFVLTCVSADNSATLLFSLEDELQAIYNDDIFDHDSSEHITTFLSLLGHLIPVLSSTSIISTWWDLVLRPALRGPKLPRSALAYARDLTLVALEKPDETNPDKQKGFQRRILDLYLLDAFNDGSGEDMLEWAELPAEERERRATWKANLEDVLVSFGLKQPEAFLMQIYYCFIDPTSRLQLLGLLNRYTHDPLFERHAPALASHLLMRSILTSLLVDNSTTVCVFSLNLLTKLLPMLAVSACNELRRLLPRLLAILARMICWKERAVPRGTSDAAVRDEQDDGDSAVSPASVTGTARSLDLKPELEWQRLDYSFSSAAAPPSAQRLFTSIYYLFPCNLIAFLRRPSNYLSEHGVECPYVWGWEEVLDNDEIKTKSEFVLLQHVANPQIIWRDADTELEQPPFFDGYDVPRITSETLMLGALRHSHILGTATATDPHVTREHVAEITNEAAESLALAEQPRRLRLSLQDMLTTSVALKSDLDVDVVDTYPAYPFHLFQPGAPAPGSEHASIISSLESTEHDDVPAGVAQVISALQREILLLRNELSFELWLSRENVKQMAFLYEHRILSRNAETERQSLHNKLREYKARAARLERLLKGEKEQNALTKNMYAEWNGQLQHKLRDLQEQKRAWKEQTASLQLAEAEMRTNFVAQGKLLAEAEMRVFQLETIRKENQHKVDRLRDYERQIEQLTATQKLWDADVQQNKEQMEVMKAMSSKYQKMVLRIDNYEHHLVVMEEQARASRRQIQSLEAKLAFAKMQSQNVRRDSESRKRVEAQAGASQLALDNKKLKEANNDLQEEADDLKAMVEVLRAQVSGRMGLLSDPTRSPITIGSPLLH